MKARSPPRFDIDALRDLAGEKAFARGEAYFRGGQVEILTLEPASVVAQVTGTEDYRTVLSGRGKKIGGECSCPAFEDWGFCKHMVAVALAANAAGGDRETQGAGTLERIRGHLKSKGADALVAMIVDLAERDAALYRKLELASAMDQTDDTALEASLRKAVDAATRTGGFIEYSRAGDWAAGVDGVLDAIAALAKGGRGGLALKLTDHAFSKIETAIQSMDDSNGHGGGLLHRLGEIHLAAASTAKPDPVNLARELFGREMEGDYDTFHGAAATYADVLGTAGLAEYRRLAAAAWEKLPPRRQARGGGVGYDADYGRLKGMLDFFAECDGDIDRRIALRRKDLSSPWNYLELAEFCLSEGREQEALAHAEEGLWIFEDGRPDERLVGFTVKLLVKRKRKADAEALLWRAFAKAPSLELYRKLRLIGGTAARDRAIALLETQLAKAMPRQWHFPSTLLIEVLMEEKRFDRAWQIARQHGASPGLAEALARASEARHPAEALEVYTRRVAELANNGSGYAEASRLIAHMAGLRGAAEQAAYVASLKEQHRRKRNFMKLLG